MEALFSNVYVPPLLHQLIEISPRGGHGLTLCETLNPPVLVIVYVIYLLSPNEGSTMAWQIAK